MKNAKTDEYTDEEMLEELSGLDYDNDDAISLLDDEEGFTLNNNDSDEENDIFGDFYSNIKDDGTDLDADLETVTDTDDMDYSKEEVDEALNSLEENFVETDEDNHTEDEELYFDNKESSNYGSDIDAYLDAANNKTNTSYVKPEAEYSKGNYLEEKVSSKEVKPTIETSSISNLFDKVSVNVKEASDIFNRNVEMKKKIDSRFEELKKLQIEHERNKKIDYEEINAYKDEVYLKLKTKKEETTKMLNELKDAQAQFDRDKAEFEEYRKETLTKIRDAEREQRLAYEERKNDIAKLEDKLLHKKDAIDEEKRQIEMERIQLENEKTDLAANLTKFNELVGDFTVGIDKFTNSN